MKKIFISGSISIKSLDDNIKKRLNNIINNNHTVLIGDANGADLLVQEYFNETRYSKVNVYCSGPICRNNVGDWNKINVEIPAKTKGRKFYMIKDKQMALDSDYGFMLWDGKSAGTINNLFNLITNNKTGLIYLQTQQIFRTINNINEFKRFISECDEQNIQLIDKKISFIKKLEHYQLPVQEQLAFSGVSETKNNTYDLDK
jgi:hypothetical protein